MRVHAAQLSLLEIDEPPKGNASKPLTRAERQTTTRRDKAAETARRRKRGSGAKRQLATSAISTAALLTTEQAASLLHVHPRTVQRLVERGELSAVHLGGAVRFDPQDVYGLIERVKCRAGKRARGDVVRPRSRTSRATASSGSFRDRIGSSDS